ncbi:DUF6404 family protein [Vibrio lentus]|uniref:DUF6404 family protein n=1 Tax=Vibrio lentus TaxID=136468 RepID=UPI002410E675|nr:DUF6404 family protein [Vibrio lentus]
MEKGVPADLTRPNAFIWPKYTNVSQTPLVFQSFQKAFLIYGLSMAVIWGSLMWMFTWHSEPEHWKTYLISSAIFGFFMGLVNVFRIVKARKKLGEKSWDNWCKKNYG